VEPVPDTLPFRKSGSARNRTRTSVVVATDHRGGLRRNEVNSLFSIYLLLPAALGPRVYSASNTNEYQKQKNNFSEKWSEAGS
jgi:hypothetical protein